jgi:hypothetical protein
MDGDRERYQFYCAEISTVVTYRLENDAMAFGQIRRERERETERAGPNGLVAEIVWS